MADISILSRLVSGYQRNVDISANTLVTTSIKVGGGVSNTELTKAILDNLVNLQNGTDFSTGTNSHTHDGRYKTITQLASTTGGSSGAKQIGVSGSPSNYTAATPDVQAHLAGIDTALAGTGATQTDSTFRIQNLADNTKKIAFSAAGIATGTTRTITMPDANVDLTDVNNAILKNGSRTFTADQPMGSNKLTGLSAGTAAGHSVRYEQAILASGANAFSANQSLGGNKLTNSADPVSSQDLVTLAYMNARLNGLTPKAPVVVATLANIALTGEQTIDGVTTSSSRVLVKNQSTASQNGIYVSNSGAWSRALDMDSLTPFDEFNGAWTSVQQGTQAGQVFVQYGTVTTVGTDPVTFAYYNPIAGLIGGDMITFAGSTFSVDLLTNGGLKSSNPGNVAGQLQISLEASNPTLQVSGSNELGAKLNGAGAIVTGASGLAVAVDGSTIEINSNALRVKDAGITLAKLASNSVDENKIVSTALSASGALTGGSGSKLAVAVDGVSIEISSNALRIKTTAYDQDTITGGGGSAAAVDHAPLVKANRIAGQTLAADTTFAVRLAVNGETAKRMYKADNDATTLSNFFAVGLAKSVGGVSAGGSVPMTMNGTHILGANDTAFSSTDIGKPVYLGASGGFTITPPTTVNLAVYRIGVVEDTDRIFVGGFDLHGIN
jgi:hypothetical protein